MKSAGPDTCPLEHRIQKSKNSDTTLGLGLSVQDLLSTVCPFCPQLFLDDSKMKNFITCFKGIACCAAPSSLSPSALPGLQLPHSAGSPQPQGGRQSVSRQYWCAPGRGACLGS